MTTSAAGPLLHLTVAADWRAALRAGALRPPSLAADGFVHLSDPEHVHLPAGRLFAGRADLMALVIDPERLGVEVRWEPGLPSDPPELRFPHAYGPVPTASVIAVEVYRPRPDGGFDPPGRLPAPQDAHARKLAVDDSLPRRVAGTEVAVDGGIAVLTDELPGSADHNRLLFDAPVSASTVLAEADRVLGGAGRAHLAATLRHPGSAATAAELGRLGWRVVEHVALAAAAGGVRPRDVEQVDPVRLIPLWTGPWRADRPPVDKDAVRQRFAGLALEDRVTDVRYLAVWDERLIAASAVLKVDGATAVLDVMDGEVAHGQVGDDDAPVRGALVRGALAMAADARCDLVVLDAEAAGGSSASYGRHGFTEIGRSWSATALAGAG